ncbi:MULTISPECIES: DUF3373 family protein [Sulfurimonas]|uniref:DUF3373 family protein n=1 Tax=Sulfurimonas TaxID=202746 RepID=UPI0012649A9A|nr:DUF3373 family protein [Sulfurimonas indica]
MKKTLLLTLPLLLYASNEELYQRIQQLEQEVKTLKEQTTLNTQDTLENSEILSTVETKTILDKVNFAPELLLRFDKFDYTTGKIEGENTEVHDSTGAPTGIQRRDEFSKHYNIATSIRFRLNMSANFDNVKFHGRLLYMNSSQSNQRLCILSHDIKTGIAGSAFDTDRAYIDYKATPEFTFSFGILPTTAGTPMQYAQNKKRNSLFPALVFNMNTYGMIATQKFATQSYIRLVLAKPYTLRPQFYPYQCNRENIDNADIIGLYSDTKLHFFGNALLSYGVNVLANFKAHPYLGADIDSSNAHNLGLMATFGLGMDIEKFLQSPATLFLHAALSNPHPNSTEDDYKIVTYNGSTGLTTGGYTGFTEADYASGTMLQKNGYSLFTGMKYDSNRDFNFGAEFNYGSKYWFSATQGAEDTFNKLAVRGYVGELYTTWKFHRYLNAKLSYLYIHENYTGSGWHFGEPAKKDATQSILSLSLEARF